MNGGILQGSGTFNVTNNGAYGGNSFRFTGSKRASANLTNYGGIGGAFNVAGNFVQLVCNSRPAPFTHRH